MEDFKDFEKKEDFDLEEELNKIRKKYDIEKLQLQQQEYQAKEVEQEEEPVQQEYQAQEIEQEEEPIHQEYQAKEVEQEEESIQQEYQAQEVEQEEEPIQQEYQAQEIEQEEEYDGYDADEELNKLGQKYDVEVEETQPDIIDYDPSDTDNPKVYIGRKDNGDVLAMYNKKK